MAKTRAERVADLAELISDYRTGEISPRSPQLIENWLSQFAEGIQDQFLKRLIRVLRKTYISRGAFKAFLAAVASAAKMGGQGVNPNDYWKQCNILDIQISGNSQREIVRLFDEVLNEQFGYGLSQTGSETGDFIYLDDCIATGSRIRADICRWIEDSAPQNAKLHIVTPILYLGSYWVDAKIKETATANGKTVSITKWRLDDFELENRLAYRNQADILWPTRLPNIASVTEYVAYLESKGRPPQLRGAGTGGKSSLFKNEQHKDFLEMIMLERGCALRQSNENLPEKVRPLGYHNLDCFGFGSMMITYRNCPNNTPLPFWIDQRGFETLFPRKTNQDAAIENMFRAFPS